MRVRWVMAGENWRAGGKKSRVRVALAESQGKWGLFNKFLCITKFVGFRERL